MSRTEQPDSLPPEWEPCAPGEVARLGKKLRGRKTRRAVLRATAGTVAAALTAGGLWLALGSRENGEYDYGGITCGEVVRRGREYMTGGVSELTRARIAEHVARCPRCGPLFRQLREQMDQMG